MTEEETAGNGQVDSAWAMARLGHNDRREHVCVYVSSTTNQDKQQALKELRL
jgi:hypothetical protein